ncbi:MAG: FKBP-type peptidyl-prolyl cis-trans isomerase [Crocinitomicaceae bacterium]
MKKTIFAFAVLGLMVSCGSPKNELDYEPTKYDSIAIAFTDEKGWETNRLESGIHIYTEKEGSEEKPKLTDFVTIHYKGYLMDGTLFDGTQNDPATFQLGGLIPGWQQGIPQFGKGGKGVLVIPPSLAYGEKGIGPIPPNSMLYFEIELVDFSATPPEPAPRADYSPQIEAYAKEKGWDAKPTGSGLYFAIENEGGTEKPQVSQNVTIFYKGYLLDGTVFDSTKDGKPANFPLGNLIPGWQEGIPKFGKGGKGKLIIPPYLGYGSRDSGPIPANSVLVFDIELVDFDGPIIDQ